MGYILYIPHQTVDMICRVAYAVGGSGATARLLFMAMHGVSVFITTCYYTSANLKAPRWGFKVACVHVAIMALWTLALIAFGPHMILFSDLAQFNYIMSHPCAVNITVSTVITIQSAILWGMDSSVSFSVLSFQCLHYVILRTPFQAKWTYQE